VALMPGADHSRLVGTTPMTTYDVVCVHTIAGNPPASAAHFSVNADGYVWQSRDTRYRSAANADGNHRVVAVEVDDHGPEFGAWNVNDGHAVPGFTSQQIEAIARVLVWVHRTHGIPLVPCPSSRPGGRGIAYHRQGIDGNWAGYAYGGRVSGGEIWSTARGKVCPGDRRITQLLNVIIPRARQLAGLKSEEDMPLTAADTNAIWMQQCTMHYADGSTETHPAAEWLTVASVRISGLVQSVAALTQAVAALSTDADLTVEQVRQLVTDAVQDNIMITGTVTVTGQNAENE